MTSMNPSTTRGQPTNTPAKADESGHPGLVRVSVGSEIDPLEIVIMALALNPWRVDGSLLQSLDTASVHQFVRNRVRSYDVVRVREQQQAFIEVLRNNDVEVLITDHLADVMCQHYARDIGFAIDETFFVARPRRSIRQREVASLRTLLPRMSNVGWLDGGTIEGGDVILAENRVLVGLGEETDEIGVSALRHALAVRGNAREVVPIRFRHRGTIHLDTKFNIVGRNLALIHTRSFAAESLRWLQEHFDLIEVTDDEATNVEVNTFVVSPGVVVVQQRSNRIADELMRRGIRTIPVDFSEVTKIPGSFRCMTLPVLRSPAPESAHDAP
jgi:N-dimethylarginine dimethylaminohydrolase